MDTTLTETEVMILLELAQRCGKPFEQVVAEYVHVRGLEADRSPPSP